MSTRIVGPIFLHFLANTGLFQLFRFTPFTSPGLRLRSYLTISSNFFQSLCFTSLASLSLIIVLPGFSSFVYFARLSRIEVAADILRNDFPIAVYSAICLSLCELPASNCPRHFPKFLFFHLQMPKRYIPMRFGSSGSVIGWIVWMVLSDGRICGKVGGGPIRQSANLPICQSANLPIRQSANPPIRQSANPPIRQSANPPIRQSANPGVEGGIG